jgi:fermentation-respiration switch protein FrsA (DUF1100 family)
MDNKTILRNVKCPVLAIYGELDQQVNPDENTPVIETAMKEGGNKDYMAKELPGLNHLFQTAKTGSEHEYFRFEETITPQALQIISDWILKHVNNL